MKSTLKHLSFPLVSVIIPVYNHQDYVEQALNSVLNQSYTNLEVIIIDDGSQDNSPYLIEKCIEVWEKANSHKNLNRQITFIKQSNQGAHETINRGLAIAKGDFLTILNSDDYYHLLRIQTLVDQVTQAHAQFAFTYVSGIDEFNKPLPTYHWWPRWYEKTKTRLYRMPSIGFILLQENFAVSTGNFFFSKELYQTVGLFKPLKLAHDLDFILRALTITEPLLIRENLYFYRIHKTNTQHQVKHLMEIELQEIYRTYLTLIYPHPPKNKLAPCHWYWPLDFARLRLQLRMDRSLNHYLSHFIVQTKETSQTRKKSSQKKGRSICLVSHDLSLSGAPKLVADLALSLKRNGYRPSIIALQDGPMRSVLEKEGITVNTASGFILKRITQIFFLAFFKTNSLTIINSTSSWYFVCLMALIKPFKTLKWYIHETTIPRTLDGRISYYLFKWFKAKKSRRLWFGSQSTRDAWKVYGVEGDVLYWSGISSQAEGKKSEAPIKNLLSVGTASARKGTHTLVNSFLDGLEKNLIPDDVTLTIIGFPDSNHPDFKGLEDLILKVVTSKFKDRIQLIGAIAPEKLDDYYEKADLFIQSSILECLPISLLSAMSKGLPIITTNVNGCAEAIQHNQNGYLCLPFNQESLLNAMLEAIKHPQESREMGKQAQKTFHEHFSLEVTEPVILSHL